MAASLHTLFGAYLPDVVWLPWAEALLAIAAALCAVALRRRRYLLGAPGFVMIALAFATDLLAPYARGAPGLATWLSAISIVLCLWGVIYLMLEGVENAIRRRRPHASTIFNDLLLLLLYAVVVMVVLHAALRVDITPLLATSAVVTVVLGLGLQETLGNIFSGLTLQLQKPFLPGDWVRFGTHLGRVQGIGWRSTRVMTRADERLEIPNSLLAKDVLTNYSTTGAVADEVFVGLTYGEPPNRVKEIVLQSLSSVPEILREPAPEVNAWEYGDSAVRYRIRYWLTDYAIAEKLRDKVISGLWYTLRRNAIEIPFPIRSVYMHEVPRAQELAAEHQQRLIDDLRSVDFLSALSDDELKLLIPTIRVHQFGRGEILEREGDIGECFHVLRHGTVEVLAKSRNGATIHIRDLTAPTFFGEIALMTGEPRTATIRAATDVEVLEINRDGFAQLFKARPQTASEISQTVTARLNETRQRTSAASSEAPAHAGQGWLLAKMRAIFDF